MGQRDDLYNLKDIIEFDEAYISVATEPKTTAKRGKGSQKKSNVGVMAESVPLEKSFGDASISQKHCNFFVNKGNAKFEDMKKLINFVSESVLKKTGIKLETEIKILE